jgi:pyruvate,orthophosphate dikinase
MFMEMVYSFDEAASLGLTKFDLGGKGYMLVEITKIGLPVPPGFIMLTGSCKKYFADGRKLTTEVKDQIQRKMKNLEQKSGRNFGGVKNPLLVSARSGAAFSMPGMMDTILNLGINEMVVQALAEQSSNERFAYETYSAFIRDFGKLVMKVPDEKFREIFECTKETVDVKDLASSSNFYRQLAVTYKLMVENESGKKFPQDPYDQLFQAISSVFDSWWNPRAVAYRKIYRIGEDLGTAVTVMSMVYGNYDETSLTGVIFTRNPSTGLKELYGEYLMNAQGEEIVSGSRTPKPINELKHQMPEVYEQVLRAAYKIEKYFKDMQDIEFTVESGKLYILQSRTGKRTTMAEVKILVDMVEEGLLNKEETLKKIDVSKVKSLFYKKVDSNFKGQPLVKGLPASPSVAIGKVFFDVNDAIKMKDANIKVILVRQETKPNDIVGIAASEGLITVIGGLTSHAAVITRGLGKPCVVGCDKIRIDIEEGFFSVNGNKVEKGDLITIDGNTGNVYVGEVPIVEPELTVESKKLLSFLPNFSD